MENFQEYPKWIAEHGKIAHNKEEEAALITPKSTPVVEAKPETLKLKKK